MSHANGQVRLADGKLFWYEYNGTADIQMPWLYDDHDELHANWRRDDHFPRCKCPASTLQLAMISSDYGGGSHWPGLVCLNCKLIVSGLMCDDVWLFDQEGWPKWTPENDPFGDAHE